jgi:cation transport protein ChaC
MSLTREDLESNRFRQLIQQVIDQTGLPLHVLSDAELEASLEATLAKQPVGGDVQLFAYGSLIWNPVFPYLDRQAGTIRGLHRRFCLQTQLGRGTPENPGLVLGLDRGGSCRGIFYRIAAATAKAELRLVWRREMVVGSYLPRWVKVWDGKQEQLAIAFVVNRQHPNYVGNLSLEATVDQIATASGQLGSAADYLLQTVDGLLSMQIRDRHLLQLRDAVLQRCNPNTNSFSKPQPTV